MPYDEDSKNKGEIKMKKAEFQLEPLTCPTCVKKIEGTLKKMKGVEGGRVLFNSSKVKLSFDESQTGVEEIESTIEKLGYSVLSNKIA